MSLRRVFDSEKKQLSFLHEGDQMIVRHDIVVHGPMHEVEMSLRVSVRYDPAGKMEAITVEPDDLTLSTTCSTPLSGTPRPRRAGAR